MTPMQIVQLGILKEFKRVLDNTKLNWFVGFGTLLGAARKGGFIPWDYDIDILMPREDYDNLANIPEVFGEPYFLQTELNDPQAAPRFMRLRHSDTAIIPMDYPTMYTPGGHMGIYIDIIPMDTVPDIIVAMHMQSMSTWLNRRMFACASWDECGYKLNNAPPKKEEFCKKEGGFPGFYSTYTAMYKAMTSTFAEGQYYAMPVLRGEKGWRVYDKDWFSDSMMLPFEGINVPAPKDYKAVLAVMYPNGLNEPDLRYNRRPEPSKEVIVDTLHSYKDYTCKYTDMLIGITGKDVHIFGAGDSLRIWLERYSQGLNVVAAYDNSTDKHGTVTYGVPIKNPTELADVDLTDARIIIASIYHKEISKQLENMDIHEYYVFIDGWKYEV